MSDDHVDLEMVYNAVLALDCKVDWLGDTLKGLDGTVCNLEQQVSGLKKDLAAFSAEIHLYRVALTRIGKLNPVLDGRVQGNGQHSIPHSLA